VGRVADATALAPTTEMGSCHRNPPTCKVMPKNGGGHMAVVRLILRLSFSSLQKLREAGNHVRSRPLEYEPGGNY
jgi:hypothetical protein